MKRARLVVDNPRRHRPDDAARRGLGRRAVARDAIVDSIRDVTKLRGEVDVPRRGELPNDGKVIDDLRKLRIDAVRSRPERCTPACDAFAPLQPETLRAIAATGVIRTFPRNTVLINEGDVGDALYIVLSGRVKVYASNEAGREFVIDFHGPGEYVGEMSLDGAPRSASVITVEPTTCAVVNRAQFRDFILAHPDFALHLIERLIHRVRVTTDNLKSLALSDVYGRLVRLLNALAKPTSTAGSSCPRS